MYTYLWDNIYENLVKSVGLNLFSVLSDVLKDI
jgi:hypothetical protein